jgi:diguanylate cyclase (GGDEF)-like protein/PAS domain S-box-containing protein
MKENSLKVLLVEDDEDDYLLTRDLFDDIKGGDYILKWISKCEAALELLKDEHFDIILVDFRLGGRDGLDFIRTLRTMECCTPAILLTGQGDQEIDIEAMKAGAADYLVKGELDASTLERSVRYAVERSRAEAALRASEARFRSVVQHSSDVITILDADSNILYTSPSIERVFGYRNDELDGKTLIDFAHPDDITALKVFLKKTKRNKDFPLLIEWRIKHPKDYWSYVESLSTNLLDDPNVGGIVVTTRNVNERKSLEKQLTHQAFHDPLTNLANRVLFRDRVEHALARAKRQKAQVAVMFLDLDNFKNINDSLGHATGDSLLKTITERLQSCVRTTDTVARLGGDEFAILLEDTEQPCNAVVVSDRVLEILEQPITLANREVIVGMSIGIAVSQNGVETADEILRNADVAMYIAKEEGKGCYAIFKSEMHTKIIERMELEEDLRQAIEQEQFLLNYQPIVRLDTQEIAGFEALVRWQHPTRGIVQPLTFISVAEENNLIIPLGRWVINKAAERVRDLRDKFGVNLTMTVNVSGKQLQDPNFVNEVAEALARSNAAPNSLILEITESVMMQNSEGTLQRLRELKSLGVRLAIDDFGTGYSSLSYLQQFPVDILKIDRSFVEKVNEGLSESAVARTIISLSKTLQLSTVAEGIENEAQMNKLLDLGCEFAQGYYFAKPLSEEQVENLFLEKSGSFEQNFHYSTPLNGFQPVELTL